MVNNKKIGPKGPIFILKIQVIRICELDLLILV